MSRQRLDEVFEAYLAAREELIAATEERVWEQGLETSQVVVQWVDDVDSSPWFERADADGEVLVDESTDTGDVYDDVDQPAEGPRGRLGLGGQPLPAHPEPLGIDDDVVRPEPRCPARAGDDAGAGPA